MRNKSILNWGIIGCGNVTEVKSGPAYALEPRFQLQKVMRRDGEAAKDYALRHGILEWTTDAEQVINDPNIQAIYIATPPDSHMHYALQVAAAGKPCCIEKPMARNHAEAKQIVAAFENAQLPLFVAYYRRSLPRFLKVKEWLDTGKIGVIRHIHWVKTRTTSPLDYSSEYNWRTDANIALAGYFDDLASHGLNLFDFLLGDIIDAKGISINQQYLYSSLDSISGCWLHKGGITGSGSWNFGAPEPIDKVEILGSEGTIRFSVLNEAPIFLKTKEEEISLEIAHPKHLHEYHVKNMAKTLFDKQPHPSDGVSGARTNWVMDKILSVL